MTDLVCCRAAPIVIRRGSTRNRLREDVAAVLGVGGAAWGCVGGKVADTEDAASKVGEVVNVEISVGAFAEGGLHLGVVISSGPLVVDGEVSADKGEGDAGTAVVTVKDRQLEWESVMGGVEHRKVRVHLIVELGLSYAALRGASSDDVEKGPDIDGGEGRCKGLRSLGHVVCCSDELQGWVGGTATNICLLDRWYCSQCSGGP